MQTYNDHYLCKKQHDNKIRLQIVLKGLILRTQKHIKKNPLQHPVQNWFPHFLGASKTCPNNVTYDGKCIKYKQYNITLRSCNNFSRLNSGTTYLHMIFNDRSFLVDTHFSQPKPEIIEQTTARIPQVLNNNIIHYLTTTKKWKTKKNILIKKKLRKEILRTDFKKKNIRKGYK